MSSFRFAAMRPKAGLHRPSRPVADIDPHNAPRLGYVVRRSFHQCIALQGETHRVVGGKITLHRPGAVRTHINAIADHQGITIDRDVTASVGQFTLAGPARGTPHPNARAAGLRTLAPVDVTLGS